MGIQGHGRGRNTTTFQKRSRIHSTRKLTRQLFWNEAKVLKHIRREVYAKRVCIVYGLPGGMNKDICLEVKIYEVDKMILSDILKFRRFRRSMFY